MNIYVNLVMWLVETLISISGDNEKLIDRMEEVSRILRYASEEYKDRVGDIVKTSPGYYYYQFNPVITERFLKWYMKLTMEFLYGERKDQYEDERKFLEEQGDLREDKLSEIKQLMPLEFMIATAEFGFSGVLSDDCSEVDYELGGEIVFTEAVRNHAGNLIDGSPDPDIHYDFVAVCDCLNLIRNTKKDND